MSEPTALVSRHTVLVVLLALAALPPATAQARKNGISVDGCTGCHGSEVAVDVSAIVTPSRFDPGDQVTIDVTIGSAEIAVAGLFVAVEDKVGTLGTFTGEGLTLSSAGLTHAIPKPASGGSAHFRFTWRAPDTVGATRINLYSVAGNGDGKRFGDNGGASALDLVYGCEAQAYYYDGDGDGFGRDEPPTMRCAGQPPPNYSPLRTDCDDFRSDAYPDATELCDGRDDDCDGAIDEGAIPIELWPDKDGDGYYKERTGQSVLGCVPMSGYAAEWGDCDETNQSVHRGAEEVCNQLDDDCDGRADEGGVRPQCGEGWCRRESRTCSAQDCVPGEPMPESCNGVDDDCNGAIDDGASCGAGNSCVDGMCRAESDVANASEADGGSSQSPGDGDSKGGEPASTGAQGCAVTAPPARAASGIWLGYGLSILMLTIVRRR